MNIIFAGTPDFAACALQALIDAGHNISLVLTKPDAVSGRGMSLKPTPVKVLALQHGLTVAQPEKLRSEETHELIRSVNADLMVVAAYGIILPQAVLDIPKHGCLNIHGSILPRWRGAAPIQRSMLSGDKETGITIIQMDAGLDTGDMLSIYPVPILDNDTAATLHDKLAIMGAKAIVETIDNLSTLAPIKQPEEGMTYAAKLTKEEAKIDWTKSAQDIALAIRAYNPVPGAFTLLDNVVMRVWQAETFTNDTNINFDLNLQPGTIIKADSKHFLVNTGDGIILLKNIQVAGSKKMNYDAFIAGRPHLINQVLK